MENKERSEFEQREIVNEKLNRLEFSNIEWVDTDRLRRFICEVKDNEGFNPSMFVEEWLRLNESRYFLLAKPVDDIDLFQGVIRLGVADPAGYSYRLLIVSSEQKKSQLSRAYDIRVVSNLKNLNEAGFLISRSGSYEAAKVRLKWN